MKSRVNFDANASFGLLTEVKEGLLGLTGDFLNPSSIHSGGQRARALIDTAREQIASLLGLSKNELIIFTSGATESNNLVVAQAYGGHLITSNIEHVCILESAKRSSVTHVDARELIPQAVAESLVPETKLVSLMLANNETGDIFPVGDFFDAVKETSPALITHTDAAQALGKISFDYSSLCCDAMSISGHKIGALTGVGALVINRDLEFTPMMLGGPQEGRLRAGTENIWGIVSFGLAAAYWSKHQIEMVSAMRKHIGLIVQYLESAKVEFSVNSLSKNLLPNTINVRFPRVKADDLVVACDLEGVALASGAACASGKPEPSHVLLGMGLSEAEARESIRISVTGRDSTDEVQRAAEIIARNVQRMQP